MAADGGASSGVQASTPQSAAGGSGSAAAGGTIGSASSAPGVGARGERSGAEKSGAISFLAEALKGAAAKSAATPSAYLLDEGVAIPGKLVARIQTKEFFDLGELLPENIECRQEDEFAPFRDLVLGSRRARKEVPNITAWVRCFAAYAIVRCAKFPEDALPLLAYQRIVVRLAETRGGLGWRSYDERFRRLAAANPSSQWSRADGNILGEVYYNRASPARSDGIDASAWLNRPLAAARARTPDRGARAPISGVCLDWNNRARCRFGAACRFRHVCLQCGDDHKASVCTRADAGERLPQRERSPVRRSVKGKE